MGCLEILNVQGGEVRLSFDQNDAPEAIRARRIITEMLRRGFVLLVEIERNGEKRYERAVNFDEARGEYVIADFAPNGSESPAPVPSESAVAPETEAPASNGNPRRGRRKRVPMADANATAVGQSAGG